MLTKSSLENGCGYKEYHFKWGFCNKDNLCPNCQEQLDSFNDGYEIAKNEIIKKIEEKILEIRKWNITKNSEKEYITTRGWQSRIIIEFESLIKEIKEKKC